MQERARIFSLLHQALHPQSQLWINSCIFWVYFWGYWPSSHEAPFRVFKYLQPLLVLPLTQDTEQLKIDKAVRGMIWIKHPRFYHILILTRMLCCINCKPAAFGYTLLPLVPRQMKNTYNFVLCLNGSWCKGPPVFPSHSHVLSVDVSFKWNSQSQSADYLKTP